MNRVLRLKRISQQALADLDLTRTAAFWAISPIEVHGPHLPLGTDLLVAERVLERGAVRWTAGDNKRVAVHLPTLPLGADVLPIAGSLGVPGDVLLRAVVACGRGLARIGFRALVLGNNHGGPRHLLALEQARRKLIAQTGMVVVSPFGAFVKAMLDRDPATIAALGIDGESPIGGPMDAHAGTFETSMALCAFADAVEPSYNGLPPTRNLPNNRLTRLLRFGARALRRWPEIVGARGDSAARELTHLAGVLDFATHNPVPSYMGAPAEASSGLGERAVEAMADLTVGMLERGLAGENLDAQSAPPLWALRALTWVPW